MVRFTEGKKVITVYPGGTGSQCAVYLNTYGEQGEEVYKILQNMNRTDFSFITVSELDWNRDMSPWDAPAVVKNDDPFTGGADEYLKLMLNEIMPKAEAELPETTKKRAIAGYSMAGMFALYSLFKTDAFEMAASASGSLWFPGLTEFVLTHETKLKPKKLYFSLGDVEHKVRNLYLRTVQENTEEIEKFFREKGVNTVFELNQGNHFANASERMAKGIAWLTDK